MWSPKVLCNDCFQNKSFSGCQRQNRSFEAFWIQPWHRLFAPSVEQNITDQHHRQSKSETSTIISLFCVCSLFGQHVNHFFTVTTNSINSIFCTRYSSGLRTPGSVNPNYQDLHPLPGSVRSRQVRNSEISIDETSAGGWRKNLNFSK